MPGTPSTRQSPPCWQWTLERVEDFLLAGQEFEFTAVEGVLRQSEEGKRIMAEVPFGGGVRWRRDRSRGGSGCGTALVVDDDRGQDVFAGPVVPEPDVLAAEVGGGFGSGGSGS